MKQNLLIDPLSDGITIKNFEAELDKEISLKIHKMQELDRILEEDAIKNYPIPNESLNKVKIEISHVKYRKYSRSINPKKDTIIQIRMRNKVLKTLEVEYLDPGSSPIEILPKINASNQRLVTFLPAAAAAFSFSLIAVIMRPQGDTRNFSSKKYMIITIIKIVHAKKGCHHHFGILSKKTSQPFGIEIKFIGKLL